MALELGAWRVMRPPRYAHKVMGVLRQVPAAALRWRLMSTNPSAGEGENPEPPPRPVRVYRFAELDALEEQAEEGQWRVGR